MRTVTLTLPEEVYLAIEVRAARDDMRIADGIAALLCELYAARKEQRPIRIVEWRG